jgi:hypothetical protein
MHLLAPVAAIGASMLLRKLMNSTYKAVTGTKAPDPQDARVSYTKAIAWAAVTAATAAVVEVVVYRVTNGSAELTQAQSLQTGPADPS